MKTIIVMTTLLLSFSSQARELACPEGSKTLIHCKSATQPYDDEVAIDFMEGAVVCQSAKGLTMYLDRRGSNEISVTPIKEIARAGATSYQGKTGAAEFALNRLMIKSEVNSTFHVSVEGERAARSLSCR